MLPEVGTLNDGIFVLSNPNDAEVKLIININTTLVRSILLTILLPIYFILFNNIYIYI